MNDEIIEKQAEAFVTLTPAGAIISHRRGGAWVRFDDKGRAAWFGPAPVDGAVWVEGVPDDVLITCRLVDGQWLPREPEPEPEPEPEKRSWLSRLFRRA